MSAELIHSAFEQVIFEPVNHTYTVDGNNLIPVSNVIKKFYKEFDANAEAERCAIKYGKPKEYFLQLWSNKGNRAASFGTSVHSFGEEYFYNRNLIPTNNHEIALVKFWTELHRSIQPTLAEARIYTKKYQYAGTFDLLCYDMDFGGYIIYDYKTNENLFKNYMGQTMFYPFDDLLDTPFNHYQLQLSCYQIPLEDINMKILDRRIVWLKGDGTYEVYPTENYTKQLRLSLC